MGEEEEWGDGQVIEEEIEEEKAGDERVCEASL